MKAHQILLAVLAVGVVAQADPRWWDPSGVPVLQNGALEWERTVAQNSEGYALVVWSDLHTGSRDVYAQMISPQGAPVWGTEGMAVTQHPAKQSSPAAVAVEDSWIVAWIDHRDEPQGGNIWVQKLDRQGNRYWSDGICVDASSHDAVPGSLRLIPDSNRGAWIVWIAAIGFNRALLVQHVTRLGDVPWSSPMIVTPFGFYDTDYSVTSDGAGGMILAWSRPINNFQRDIRATRIQANGTLPWGEYVTVAGMPPLLQSEPEVCSDGSGGAYLAWISYIGTTGDVDLWAQRLNANGETMWSTPGLLVCSLPGYRGYLSLAASRSGAYTDGGLLVWMDQRENGHDRYFVQKLSPAGTIRWTENGVMLCDSANSYQTISVATDDAGGLVCTWEDYGNSGGDYWEADIVATRLNAQGQHVWLMEHVPVITAPRVQSQPVIVPQSDGYLVVARSEYGRGEFLAYQKLSRQTGGRLFSVDGVDIVRRYDQFYGWARAVPMSGGRTAVLWNEDHAYFLILDSLGAVEGEPLGQPVAPRRSLEYRSHGIGSVCSDGAGGFFVACTKGDDEYGYLSFLTHVLSTGELASDSSGEWLWGDDVNEGQWSVAIAADGLGGCYAAFAGIVNDQQGLFVRRYDSSCRPLWEGVAQVSTHALWYQQNPKTITQPDGGCLVAFGTSTQGLAIARVSPDGILSWTTTVCDSTAHGFNFRYGFVPDGQNGAYCVWFDCRYGFDPVVFAQHITAAGSLSWQEGGIPIADSLRSQTWPYPDVDPDGNLLVVWRDADPTEDQIMAQKFSRAGTRLWGSIGTLVCRAPSGQYYPMAVSDQSGGLYVVWSDYRLAPGPVLAGSHVNADGEIGPDPFWAPELGGILSDSILGIVNEPWLVAGPSGTAVVFWVHDRQQSSNQFLDLYAQRIGAVGLSAEEPASTVPSGFALFPCYPNPFNSATAIVFELATASFVKLTVYDLLGREVAVLTDRVLPMGRHEYLFNASALASGIYFYRLQAGNFTQTRKMVLVR